MGRFEHQRQRFPLRSIDTLVDKATQSPLQRDMVV